MRSATLSMLMLFAVLTALVSIEPVAAAQEAPANNFISTTVNCPPFNLFNPDAGPTVNGRIICSDLYTAVRVETENTGAIYFCGKTGCTRANYASAGHKRCLGCSKGGTYIVRGTLPSGLRCISGTADAGVTVAVMCARAGG